MLASGVGNGCHHLILTVAQRGATWNHKCPIVACQREITISFGVGSGVNVHSQRRTGKDHGSACQFGRAVIGQQAVYCRPFNQSDRAGVADRYAVDRAGDVGAAGGVVGGKRRAVAAVAVIGHVANGAKRRAQGNGVTASGQGIAVFIDGLNR